jgi:hypothetical protein
VAAVAEVETQARTIEANPLVWSPLHIHKIPALHKSPTPQNCSFFKEFYPGVGISFVRRVGSGVGADSKFVVKRLVQGSDTAMQGDVEVNDVVVRVRVGASHLMQMLTVVCVASAG